MFVRRRDEGMKTIGNIFCRKLEGQNYYNSVLRCSSYLELPTVKENLILVVWNSYVDIIVI